MNADLRRAVLDGLQESVRRLVDLMQVGDADGAAHEAQIAFRLAVVLLNAEEP